MEKQYVLSRPDLFDLETESGSICHGARQEWYPTEWQRKAGCGPLTAATILSYLSHTRPGLSVLYPSGSRSQAEFVGLMERVWEHMTPGRLGVNSLHMFTNGVASFAGARHCILHTRELDIPRFRLARPTFSQCVAFLRTGLSADCPVAFLNFSRGKVPYLESWHWVPVIAMEQQSSGPVICTILNDGKERKIDFRLWYQTSRTGGGLVYIPKEQKL